MTLDQLTKKDQCQSFGIQELVNPQPKKKQMIFNNNNSNNLVVLFIKNYN
jgi:hypothetical protein